MCVRFQSDFANSGYCFFSSLNPATAAYNKKESGAYESSSGLLDLDQVKGNFTSINVVIFIHT